MPCQETGRSHGHPHARRQGSSLPCPRLSPPSAAWRGRALAPAAHRRAPLRKALCGEQHCACSSSAGDSPRPTVCPGPGQDWGSCALCWEGTSACGSNNCCEEEESDPGAGNRPGPLSWVHTTPVAKGSVWLS